MYFESVTLIDEGDIIAFKDDLQFDTSIFDATPEELATIDWVKVDKVQITGSIVILQVTHEQTQWSTAYRVADFVKVIVSEDE